MNFKTLNLLDIINGGRLPDLAPEEAGQRSHRALALNLLRLIAGSRNSDAYGDDDDVRREREFAEEAKQHSAHGWFYTSDYGWVNRDDARQYMAYLARIGEQFANKQAEDAYWNDVVEPQLKAVAAAEGMNTHDYLERALQRGAERSQDAWLREAFHGRSRAGKRLTEYKLAPHVMETKSLSGEFRGYLAVYGNVDAHGDAIQPGAFTKTLSEIRADPYSKAGLLPLLYQHDKSQPIGVFTELVSDAKGVRFTARINTDTQLGRDTLSNIRSGVLSQMSIGYYTIQHGWKGDVRLLKEIRLLEGSVVTLASNSKARID